jgi:hypothetical protein
MNLTTSQLCASIRATADQRRAVLDAAIRKLPLDERDALLREAERIRDKPKILRGADSAFLAVVADIYFREVMESRARVVEAEELDKQEEEPIDDSIFGGGA